MASATRPQKLRLAGQIKRVAGHILLFLLTSAGVASCVHGCSAKSMTLSWQDTSENEDGFRIYRITGDHKTVIAEVGPNVTRYVDKDAPHNACYLVAAFNAAGESTPAGSACMQTETANR